VKLSMVLSFILIIGVGRYSCLWWPVQAYA